MTIDIDEAKVERNEFGLWLGWTLAIAGGMLLGFLPTILLVNLLNLGLAQIIVPVLAGTIVGLAHWVALRRFLTASSDWILAGGTSWAVGFWASQAVLPWFYTGGLIPPAVSTTVIAVTRGLVAGAITGLALIWIVREPDKP